MIKVPIGYDDPTPFLKALFSDREFVGLPSFKSYLIENGHRRVDGWIMDGAITGLILLSFLQKINSVEGDVCEIGIHHGRSFLAMMATKSVATVGLAIDVFEDQQLNVDLSGKGDLDYFRRNVNRWSASVDRVQMHSADSLTLSCETILNLLEGRRVSMFSVDGGHTVSHVINDISLSAGVLGRMGLTIVDDFGNGDWPGVTEGVICYLGAKMEGPSEPQLVPLAYGDNKLYLCHTSDYDFLSKFCVNVLLPMSKSWKKVELCGHVVYHLSLPNFQRLLEREDLQQAVCGLQVNSLSGEWHAQEGAGRWTACRRAGVVIDRPSNRRTLACTFLGVISPRDQSVTQLSFYVDGAEFCTEDYIGEASPHRLMVAVDPGSVPLTLEFATNNVIVPSFIGVGGDTRSLGVLVAELYWL